MVPSPSSRAAVLTAFGQPLALQTRPLPEPAAGQVLVKLSACGVCHTDLHLAQGDWPARPQLPIVLGHEGCGEVAAVGPDVRDVAPGDRVGVPWLHDACGQCELCRSGHESICPHQRQIGFGRDGCFSDHVLASAKFLIPIPPELDWVAAAPLLCAGVTASRAVRLAELPAGEPLVIVGAGGVGHLAVQFARARGLRPIVIDNVAARLEQAFALGAERALHADDDPTRRLHRELGGVRAALVTASSASAVSLAARTLRKTGLLILVGLPAGVFSLSTFDVVVRSLRLQGTLLGSRDDIRETLQIAAAGKVAALTQTFAFEQINAAMSAVREGKVTGRAVLTMGR